MHDTIGGSLGNWLANIGVVALIYWGWRLIVLFRTRAPRGAPAPATLAPLTARAEPAQVAVHLDDIPVIAAAVHAMLGAHRIVHLEPDHASPVWAIEGRWMNQTSHTPR